MKRAVYFALLSFAAIPARADISDGGNLSIGGQAIIAGTMTVQGNAFSVGSSTLSISSGSVGIGTASPTQVLDINSSGSVIIRNGASYSTITASGFFGNGSGLSLSANVGLLSSSQTFTGSDSFSNSASTLTIVQSQVTIGTTTSTNNFKIAAGGAAVFSPLLHNTTFLTDISADTNSGTFGVCVATITITTSGGNVRGCYYGSLWGPTGVAHMSVNILQDGSYVSPLSSTVGVCSTAEFDNNAEMACDGCWLFTGVSAGSHSYCLTMDVQITSGNGRAHLSNSGSNATTGASATDMFVVTEER